MTRSIALTLVGKPGCHLCDDAREVVAAVRAEVEALADAPAITFEERDILVEPDLFDRFAEEIPVVLLDGRVHAYWRIDAARLKAALLA
ncbi:glutaredoxin family protein [Agromyces sp. MMS24-JH15]|uniref:glutaredoxin family protein n=1 Tax=Agromyces sp. MMS24-JH15 TaxID=3243765 RepID=UPI00374A58E2